jgi:hypothetical protein
MVDMKNKPYMTFQTKKDETIDMSKETFARWLCLMEAFYIIDKKAEELNIQISNDDFVKPLAFEKYIDQRFEGMMLDLTHDEKNNLIGKKMVSYHCKPESVVASIY